MKAPNLVWCTDFTYIRLSNGNMRYNCAVMDLYDRSVVSSLNSEHINTELAKAAVEKAIEGEKPGKGLILHSDQGSQYSSWEFVDYCKKRGIRQSMSKAGRPYDNAPMERFYNTFKNELIYPNSFSSAESLDEAVSCSGTMTSADFSWQSLLHGGEYFMVFAMSMRPPRVPTRSFPLIPAPFTAGVPCSYWTLVCSATLSTLHSLSGYHALWVQLLQASGLPPASFRPHLTVTPLPLAAPFPLPGGSGNFTP